MHLTEVLSLRPVPAAAVFFALTRRCPLSCAHCSTNSLLNSEEHPEEIFTRFADTFTADNRPELVIMSGGEPLLRPKLVLGLAERAHAVDARTYVISGMFFARGRTIPRPIRRAIDAVDHFCASLDAYHEREVARADVFRVLEELLSDGKDVSLQVVGLGASDPYLADVTDDIRRTFDDRVPVLVGGVGPTGRAADWLDVDAPAAVSSPEAAPCTLAAWPLVTFDGTIVACCNQDVVDGPPPEHLRLGHAAHDGWPTVRERFLRSALLRAIRLFGPEYVADRHSNSVACDGGYCTTCFRLSTDPELERRVQAVVERRTTQELERQLTTLQRAAGPVAFARRYGISRYAELVTLGLPHGKEEARAVA